MHSDSSNHYVQWPAIKMALAPGAVHQLAGAIPAFLASAHVTGGGNDLCDMMTFQDSVLNQRGHCSALIVPDAQLAVLILAPCVYSAWIRVAR